jgi:hypothetical protein
MVRQTGVALSLKSILKPFATAVKINQEIQRTARHAIGRHRATNRSQDALKPLLMSIFLTWLVETCSSRGGVD